MDNRLRGSLFINERFFPELFLASPSVKDIFQMEVSWEERRLGKRPRRQLRTHGWRAAWHRQVTLRRGGCGLARRGHGLPQSRAGLRPGRVCCMLMDWGSDRRCELESCVHLFYFYTSFNKSAGISHLSQRRMRKPKPRLGFWQFRVQLSWRGGERQGNSHTLPAATITSDRILAASLNTESRHTPTSWDLPRETPGRSAQGS